MIARAADVVDRLIPVLAVLTVAVAVTTVLKRRRTDPPTQATGQVVPSQLDRSDFGSPVEPWLVVAFTSSTCDGCAAVWAKAKVLEASAVAVREIDYLVEPALHERYGITGVPTVVVVGPDGDVGRSFVGPVSAVHLWAAVAELREPGSAPTSCVDHDSDESAI